MAAKSNISISSLSNFIQKEVRHEEFSIKRVLGADPEESIISGSVLGPLRATAREGSSLVLRGEGLFFSRFRAGDQVDLGIIDPQTKKFSSISGTSIKMVRFPEPGVLEVLVPGKLIREEDVELFLLPQTHSGIKKLLRQKLFDLENMGYQAEHFQINKLAIRENFEHMSENLNSTQKEALRFLVENDFKGLVQGPPGTGKTHLLVALMNLAVHSGLRVGLASLSHAAVDNALARVLKNGVDPDAVVRVASKIQKVKKEPYGSYDINSFWSRSFADLEYDYPLYASTMHSFCMTNSPPEIDVLIIDEASQVPFYFYPFLNKLCSRVVMFGDHKQLPPVIQVENHDLPAEDIFSYQISQGSYPMLEIQYRMNEGVQEWSSSRFYEGRLQPHESNRYRDILKGLPSESGLLGEDAVNLTQHKGASVNNANLIEAKKVADLVDALKAEGRIPLHEIGIVTPHRAQAGAICAQLQEKIGLIEMQNILVDTVERFQGQEREAMIFSMGAEKEEAKRGDRAFLGDGRRLNVAVTRAKSRFYCLAPQKLIATSLGSSDESQLSSFLKWCNRAS